MAAKGADGSDPVLALIEIAMLLSRSRHLLRSTAVAVCTVAVFVLADGSTAVPAVAPPWRGEGVRRGTRREGTDATGRPTPTATWAPRAAAGFCSTSSAMTREENAVRDRCARRAAARTASHAQSPPMTCVRGRPRGPRG